MTDLHIYSDGTFLGKKNKNARCEINLLAKVAFITVKNTYELPGNENDGLLWKFSFT